jgi:SAM-dependent methyltransferase
VAEISTRPSAAGHARFFDAEAAGYDAAYEAATPAGHALRARLAAALALLDASRPGDALDAGMGPGRLCAELDRRGWTVSGVDASERMVDAARARLAAAAERLVQGDLGRLPFPAAAFDAVTATGVLEYADDLERAFAELRRVLRPGGVAVVSCPHLASVEGAWLAFAYYPAVRAAKALLPAARPAPRPVRPPTLRTFETALDRAGWRIDARRYVNPVVLVAPVSRALPTTGVRASERLEGRQGALTRRLAAQLVYRLAPA